MAKQIICQCGFVGRGETAADAAEVMIALGEPAAEFDREGFYRRGEELVSRNLSATIGEVQAGDLLGQVLQAAGNSGLRPPSELTMMAKALLNLDEAARILDPTFEPNPTIEQHAGELMRKKMLQGASPGNIMAAAIDAKEFAEKLPGRINKVMDALAEGQLTLNVQGIDEKELMRISRAFHKPWASAPTDEDRFAAYLADRAPP